MITHDIVQQMLAAGLGSPPLPLNVTGKVVRFGPKKVHWYRLRELCTDRGTHVIVGAFGNHKGQQRWRVDVDWRGISQEEREALAARSRLQAEANARASAEASRRASMTASEMWHEAARTGSSRYLERKGVEPEACRFVSDGSIVVPLLRYDAPRDEALKALQQIWPAGTKRFTKGFQKAGVCVRLGQVEEGAPLLICEGYSTGLTLRMAVDRRLPVFVALDSGNLRATTELLRQLHADSKMLICADDDHRTHGNPGRHQAREAARAVSGCHFIYPIFRMGNRGTKDTDFNDLQRREGLDCVRRQLGHVLALLGHAARHQPRAA